MSEVIGTNFTVKAGQVSSCQNPLLILEPAKYSRALIRHIYQHLVDEGWLKPGDVVCDPFSGVALGALHAMKHGLNWVGVELEQKFVQLGQQNIDLWNSKFSKLPGWGSAIIIRGDSRNLSCVLEEDIDWCTCDEE